jgi:hypothetical protein
MRGMLMLGAYGQILVGRPRLAFALELHWPVSVGHVEEVRDCYGRCMGCVVFLRFLVDGVCLSCDCVEHGVGAERLNLGTRVCK